MAMLSPDPCMFAEVCFLIRTPNAMRTTMATVPDDAEERQKGAELLGFQIQIELSR